MNINDHVVLWGEGLAFSGFVGWLGTTGYHRWVRHSAGLPSAKSEPSVPAWITGVTERLAFTVLIGLGAPMSSIPTAMLAWLALKMATNWNSPDSAKAEATKKAGRASAIAALLAGVVSMLFAIGGGLIVTGKWW